MWMEKRNTCRSKAPRIWVEGKGGRGREWWLSGVVDRNTEGKRKTQFENRDNVVTSWAVARSSESSLVFTSVSHPGWDSCTWGNRKERKKERPNDQGSPVADQGVVCDSGSGMQAWRVVSSQPHHASSDLT